jgi:glutathione S-transferase
MARHARAEGAMKLYLDPISTTSRPLTMFLYDHPQPVEIVPVNLFAGEHQSEAFAALNPNRAVPVLADGDFVLTECSAILKHLADKIDAAYPAEPAERSRVNQWMDWFNTGLYRDLGYNYVYPQVVPDYRFENPQTQADVLARGAERAAKWLAILDAALEGKPYLGGAQPCIADYLGAAYVSLGDWVGFDFSPHSEVSRWLAAFRSRPCWEDTHAPWNAFVTMLRGAQLQPA